jgi:Kef-type K+ transport system membrane component KefB
VFAVETSADAIIALKRLDLEHLLLPVLAQLIVIIAAARIFGALARKLGQPAVVGEILAGLILGPSLFGWLFPGLFQAVFKPHLHGVPDDLANAAFPKIFQVLSQIGLIFLLFLIGLEFDFTHLKLKGRAAVTVSVSGILLPFALGALIAPIIHPVLEDHPVAGKVPLLGLTLFMGVAMSITAIPILGRIMIEMGINRTKIGAVVISAAAVDDACGWILLATVAALSKAGTDGFSWTETATMIGLTVGFAAAMFLIVRPLLLKYFTWSLRKNDGQLSLNALAVLLIVMLACAIATNLIGIFAIFGAFILGAILSDQQELREAVKTRIRDLITSFFLPIFFTYTGLRTDIGSMIGLWWVAGLVLLAAVFGKFGGCLLAARVSGFGWKESSIIGVMMNTRALMELIVINLGYDLGVVPKSLFCALVIMAVVTTVMTSPILLRLRFGTELEEPIRKSGFVAV